MLPTLTIKEAFQKGLKGFTLKSFGQKYIAVRLEQKNAVCINCTTSKFTSIWAEKLTAQTFKLRKDDPTVKFLENFHRISLIEAEAEPTPAELENDIDNCYNWGTF